MSDPLKIIQQNQLFKRQITLSEIGDSGQQKLQDTRVVVIGCGGLGTVAASYLAGSGVGSIHLVDFDRVAVTNLHRQLFYSIYDIDKPKIEILKDHIQRIAPFTSVTFTKAAAVKDTIFEILEKGDIILDCTDSLPVKYLINDACVLKDKILVYGSLFKYDGYVATFNVQGENGLSANLRDAFPEISAQAVPNCAEAGTLNTIVGIIGLMQANEVLKLATGIGKPLINELLIYNSLENSQFKMKLKMSEDSPVERKKRFSEIFEKETYYDAGCEVQREDLLVSAGELKKWLVSAEDKKVLHIISVIEDLGAELPFEVAERIPFSKFDAQRIALRLDAHYVIVCNKGITSYTAALALKEKYQNINIYSLEKGIENY